MHMYMLMCVDNMRWQKITQHNSRIQRRDNRHSVHCESDDVIAVEYELVFHRTPSESAVTRGGGMQKHQHFRDTRRE